MNNLSENTKKFPSLIWYQNHLSDNYWKRAYIISPPKKILDLNPFDSVASAADVIQKEAKNKLPLWGFEPIP